MKKKIRNDWHSMPSDEVIAALHTDAENGLSARSALHRRSQCGENAIWRIQSVPVLDIIKEQMLDLGSVLLGIAAVLSALFNRGSESVFLLALLFSSALLRAWLVVHAYRVFEKAARENIPTATVIRDGSVCTLSADCIVPGDIVKFRSGDPVAADVRLLSGLLTVTEAGITENQTPQVKSAEFPISADSVCEDRSNVLFAGSTVVAGKGTGVVFATGERTYIYAKRGHISVPSGEELPAVSRANQWTRRLSLLMIAAALLMMICGVFLNHSEMGPDILFLSALSLAVASSSELLGVAAVAAHASCIKKSAEGTDGSVLIRVPKAIEPFARTRYLILSDPVLLQDLPQKKWEEVERLCAEEFIRFILFTDSVTDTLPSIMKGAPVFSSEHALNTYFSSREPDSFGENIVVFAKDRNQRARFLRCLKKHIRNCAFVGDALRDIPCFRFADGAVAVRHRKTAAPQCLFSAADVSVLEKDTGDGLLQCLALLRASKRVFVGLRRAAVYLLSVQSLRLTLAFVTVFFGFPLLSSVSLLWWGLILDLFAVLAIAHVGEGIENTRYPASFAALPTLKNGVMFPIVSGILTGILVTFASVLTDKFLQAGSVSSVLYAAGVIGSLFYLFTLNGFAKGRLFINKSAAAFLLLSLLTLSWILYAHLSWVLFCALLPAITVPLLYFIYYRFISDRGVS